MPGKITTRLPAGQLRRYQALYNEARDCLNFLKGYGAFLHHVRPEQLLSREAYVAVKLAGKSSTFGAPFGAPVLEYKNASAVQARRREFMRTYPLVAR